LRFQLDALDCVVFVRLAAFSAAFGPVRVGATTRRARAATTAHTLEARLSFRHTCCSVRMCIIVVANGFSRLWCVGSCMPTDDEGPGLGRRLVERGRSAARNFGPLAKTGAKDAKAAFERFQDRDSEPFAAFEDGGGSSAPLDAFESGGGGSNPLDAFGDGDSGGVLDQFD
jgi:hypothetical protein